MPATPDASAPAATETRYPSGQPAVPGGHLLGAPPGGAGLITPEQLDKALADQPEVRYATRRAADPDRRDRRAPTHTALAGQFGIEVGDLSRQAPDPQLAGRLSEAIARQYLAVPLREVDGVVVSSSATPGPGCKQSSSAIGSPVQLLVVPASTARQALDRAYRALADVDRMVKAFKAADAPRRVARPGPGGGHRGRLPGRQGGHHARHRGAAGPGVGYPPRAERRQLRVRFRIDGALHDVLTLPISMAGALVSRVKILANMNIVERRRAQDGQFATEVDGRGIDVRVSTMATVFGEKCVMRVLDKSRSLYKLGELGMPPDTQTSTTRWCAPPSAWCCAPGRPGAARRRPSTPPSTRSTSGRATS